MIARPKPPMDLLLERENWSIPSPELAEWVRQSFLSPDSPLANPDHDHLEQANIGLLWTSAPNSKQMRRIVGTAEMPGASRGSKWQKARSDQQMVEWFGQVPDFLITIDALYADEVKDTEFCSLIEHEMYHCSQEIDGDGLPKFTRDGVPVWGIRGHDVEEFVGVVRRYGAAAAPVRELLDAANAAPEMPADRIGWACGTCGRPG